MTLIPVLAAALMAAQATPAAGQSTPDTTPAGVPAGAGAPAGTAATAKVAVGAAVSDQSGAPVGTIAQISGSTAVIDTGTSKAGVPLTAIGPGAGGGLVTTVTKAQLDTAAAQGPAQLKAALVPGASVKASDGTTVVGTVKAADEKFVTVTTDKGDVRLPANAFAAPAPGNLVVALTADQFAAAVTQSLAATGGSPSR